MQFEKEMLYLNFKGEPWAILQHNLKYMDTTSRSSSVTYMEYQHNMHFLLLLARILGIMPLQFGSDGEASFKIISLLTLYCVMLQCSLAVGMVLIAIERIEWINRPESTFHDNVLEIGCILCFLPSLLVPLTHVPEIKKKIMFFNDWEDLQREFHRVTKHILRLHLRRKSIRKILFSSIIAVIFTFLLIFLQRGYTWWQAAVFAHCTLLNNLMIDFWVLNTDAFIAMAERMEETLRERLSDQNTNSATTITEYNQLWRKLSKHTQDLGNSMGFTFGGQVVMHFSLQLVGTFGFMSQVKRGNLPNTLGFLATALIFSWLTFVFCNAAERATNVIGIEFTEKLRTMCNKYNKMDAATKLEMNIFLQTIIAYPPVISLCGFVQVNRALQTSLVSSIVTYLVVLAQFQLSSDTEAEETTGNKTNTS